MTTANMFTEATLSESDTLQNRDEYISDRVSTFAAMGGGVLGVAVGSMTAYLMGSDYSLILGTLGVFVGSITAAGLGSSIYRIIQNRRNCQTE